MAAAAAAVVALVTATAASAAFAAGMYITGIALTVVAIASNYLAAQEALNDLDIKNIPANGHLVNSRKTSEVIPVVYGTCRVGGNWIWMHTDGEDNKYLYIVMSISEGPITSIDAIYLDGNELSTTTQAGLVTWAGVLGNDTNTNPDWIVSAGFNDNLPYLARLCVKLTWATYTEDNVQKSKWRGVPNITALVKGRPLYDPRTETTAFSDNAALVLLDFLRNKIYGLGIADEFIDFDSFAQAADYCDAKGFKYNGVIATERRFNAITEICNHFDGILKRSQGIYSVVIKDLNYEPVVAVYTNDDIIEGSFSYDIPSTVDQYNTLKITFIDPEINYQANSIILEDKELVSYEQQKTLDIKLAGANREQAIKLGNRILKRQRINHTVSVVLGPRALCLEQGDVIKLTYEDFGINERLFRIVGMRYLENEAVAVNLQEEDYVLYDDDVTVSIPYYPQTTLPDPFEVPPGVVNLNLYEDTYQQKDGSWTSRLVIEFEEPQYGYLNYYEIHISENGGPYVHVANLSTVAPGTTLNYYYENTKEGASYTVKVVTVSYYGIRSVAITKILTILGQHTVPPDITFIYDNCYFDNQIHLEWTSANIKDLYYYELRLDTNFGDEAGLVLRTKETYCNLSLEDFEGFTSATFYIKAVNKSGLYSTNYDTVTVTNAPPDDVTFIESNCYYTNEIFLSWSNLFIKDLDYYEIRLDTNFGSDTGLITRTKETTIRLPIDDFKSSRSWTFYIKAKDLVENWSVNYGSITVTNNIPPAPSISADVQFETIIIKWQPVNDEDVVKYEIEKDGTVIDVGLNTSYSFIGEAGVSYQIRVRAVDSIGPGEWSSYVTPTASALSVTTFPAGYNLIQDWAFVNWPEGWYISGDLSRVNITDGIAGIYSIQNNTAVFSYFHPEHSDQHLIPADHNRTYIVEAYCRCLSGSTGNCVIRVDFLDENFSSLGAAEVEVAPATSWYLARKQFGYGTSNPFPAGTKYIRFTAILNWDTTQVWGTAGDSIWQVQSPKIREVIEAAWIRDAAIQEAHIADAAIGTAKIKDASITDAKITGVIKSNLLAPDGNPVWKIDKDGSAEFRGITVYDSNGNPILTTDGTVWEKVYGDGKPEDNATVGAQAGINLKDASGNTADDIIHPNNPISETNSDNFITDGAIYGNKLNVKSLIHLDEGGKLIVGNNNILIDSVLNNIIVSPDGGPSNNDYAELKDGDIYFYYFDGTQHVVYKTLRRIEFGIANNGERVTIPGIFRNTPVIFVSPSSIDTYNPSYTYQNQKLVVTYTDLTQNDDGSWSFTPIAKSVLSDSIFTDNVSDTISNSADGTPISLTYNSPPNITTIDIKFSLKSYREAGSYGVYYYRKAVVRIYLNDAVAFENTYTFGTSFDWIQQTVSIDCPQGEYSIKIEATYYDLDGSTFTVSPVYEYANESFTIGPYTAESDSTLCEDASITGYFPTSNYYGVGDWELINASYSFNWYYYIADCAGSVTCAYAYLKHGTTIIGNKYACAGVVNSGTITINRTLSSYIRNITVYTDIDVRVYEDYVACGKVISKLNSATVNLSFKRLLPITPTDHYNGLNVESITYTIGASEYVADGSLLWIAIGG